MNDHSKIILNYIFCFLLPVIVILVSGWLAKGYFNPETVELEQRYFIGILAFLTIISTFVTIKLGDFSNQHKLTFGLILFLLSVISIVHIFISHTFVYRDDEGKPILGGDYVIFHGEKKEDFSLEGNDYYDEWGGNVHDAWEGIHFYTHWFFMSWIGLAISLGSIFGSILIIPLRNKKKFLFLSAVPIDTPNLRISDEFRDIKNRIDPSGRFIWETELSISPENLAVALGRKQHIIHFCGHGKLEGILAQDEYKEKLVVEIQPLVELLSQHKENLELIVLNACYSAEQAEILSKELGITCIGHNDAIEGEAAGMFARGFYSSLANGLTYSECFVNAKFNIVSSSDQPGKFDRDKNMPELWIKGEPVSV